MHCNLRPPEVTAVITPATHTQQLRNIRLPIVSRTQVYDIEIGLDSDAKLSCFSSAEQNSKLLHYEIYIILWKMYLKYCL